MLDSAKRGPIYPTQGRVDSPTLESYVPALAADIVEKLIEDMSLLLTNPISLLQYLGRISPPHLEKPFNIQEICLWDR